MNLINAYIQYLRDVSRRIISRAGFENVLPKETRKRKNYFYSLNELIRSDASFNTALIKKGDYFCPPGKKDLFSYLKSVTQFLEISRDQRLFLGMGLINGEFNGSKIAAPLMTILVEADDENWNVSASLNRDSFQLNYDILAKFLNIRLSEESEDSSFTADELEKIRIIDDIENEIESYDSIDQINPIIILQRLQEKIETLKQILIIKNGVFDYKDRFPVIPNQMRFYNEWFFFTHKVPDELSTYEALNNLIRKDSIENITLQKLFERVISNKTHTFESELKIDESKLDSAISKTPLSLSQRQVAAIKTMWNNEISYIEGPPGTGKSHTICAIMIIAALLGKKVLLVSQKKAAIHIVKEKVDKILGDNSIINIAAKDKTSTRNYLQNIYTKSADRITIKIEQNKIQDLFQKLDEINLYIFNTENQIVEDIKLENDLFRAHVEYIKKRNDFIKYYEIDLKNYQFFHGRLDKTKGKSAIDKFYYLKQKKQKTRLELIYEIKFLSQLKNLFNCDLSLARTDINYVNIIFDINYYYSEYLFYTRKIDKQRLNIYRKQLEKLKSDKEKLLLELLPLDYNNSRLWEAGEDKISRNTINDYNTSLRWKAPHLIQKSWDGIDFELLTDILPLWCCELRNLGSVFPLISEIFDVVIVDESSQVNIAEIIPAFYRGKKFCIIGDEKQLHLNATGVGFALSKSFDSLCWNKNQLPEYGVTLDEAKLKHLIVSEASILKFVNVQSSGITQTQLDEHYRSMPKLAHFNSKEFYTYPWKIMTENAENIQKNCFKALRVKGKRDENKKFVQAEIDELKALLYAIIRKPGYLFLDELKPFYFKNPPSIGILSFLTNQRDIINEMLDESDFSDEEKENHDIMVETTEGFQGNERDIMIITVGLDEYSKWGKSFYENRNRFNVATSRAKYFTYFIFAGIPKSSDLFRKYLNHFGVKIIPGDEIETTSFLKWSFNPESFRFDSEKIESTFESYVCDYLLDYIKERQNFKIFNQVTACGQKRLDFVIYNPNTKITCAVEVDGADHFVEGGHKYTEAHLDRIEILKRAGWKIVHTKYYHWYSNGWLCEKNDTVFLNEIKRLYKELDDNLF